MASNEQPPKKEPIAPDTERAQIEKVAELQHERRVRAINEAEPAEILETGNRPPAGTEVASEEMVGPPRPEASTLQSGTTAAPEGTQTALSRALESARALKTSKKSPSSNRRARKETVRTTESEFNASDEARQIEGLYRDLEERVREIGVEPNDLPPPVWKRVNAAIAAARNLSALYTKETNGTIQNDIAARLKKIDISLGGGKLHQDVLREAERLAQQKKARAAPVTQGNHAEKAVDLPAVPFVPQPDIATAVPAAPKEAGASVSDAEATKRELSDKFEEAIDRAYVAMDTHPEKQIEYFNQILKLRQRESDLAGKKLTSSGKAALARTQAERWDLQAALDRSIDAEAGESPRDVLEDEFWSLDPSTPLERRRDLLARIEERLKEPSGETAPTLTEYRHERENERRRMGLEAVRDSLIRSVGEIEAQEERSPRSGGARGDLGAVVPAVEVEPEAIPEELGTIQPGISDEAAADPSARAEGTPREWREKLKSLIGRAKERAGGAKETVLWWKSSSEALVRRSKELDLQAENIGGIETLFRKYGEAYNKVGWKTKLALGLTLGIGAGVTLAAGSVAFGSALLLGTAMQRTAALSSTFLKFEKQALDRLTLGNERADADRRQVEREAAMAKAILYTALMTGGSALLSYAVANSETAQDTRQWLADKLFGAFGPKEVLPTEAPRMPAPQTAMPPEVRAPQPAEVAATASTAEGVRGADAVAAPLAPEAQGASDATNYASTAGYEVVDQAPNGTPIYERITEIDADAGGADDANAPVNATDEGSAAVLAGEARAPVADAVRLPPLQEDAPVADDTIVVDSQGNPVMTEEGPLRTGMYDPNVQAPAPVEDAIAVGPLPHEAPATIETMPLSDEHAIETQELPESTADAAPAAEPDAPVSNESGPSGVESAQEAVTQTGEPIDVTKPAIYEAALPSGETILTAYGGTDEERLAYIQQFVSQPEHAGKLVRWSHDVPSIFGPKTMVDDFGGQRSAGGMFTGLFKTMNGATMPTPDSFVRKVGP